MRSFAMEMLAARLTDANLPPPKNPKPFVQE
jgi:hypothetical protein